MYVLAFAGVPSVLCCAIDLQFFDFFLCEAGGFGDNAYGNAEPLEVLCIFERLLVCTFSFTFNECFLSLYCDIDVVIVFC